MISSREEHLTRLNGWQSKLSHMLGCPSRELPESPLPSEEALQDLSDYLRDQEAEYERRVQVFLKKQEDIKRLIGEKSTVLWLDLKQKKAEAWFISSNFV